MLEQVLMPPDRTLVAIEESGQVYRCAGGAPIYLTTPTLIGADEVIVPLPAVAFDSLRVQPADGTLIQGLPSNEIFRIAGGAPIYVSNWANIGGPAPSTPVDDIAIAQAGQASPFNHLTQFPADGTFIQGFRTPDIEPTAWMIEAG
jgi:hypothetical protein